MHDCTGTLVAACGCVVAYMYIVCQPGVYDNNKHMQLLCMGALRHGLGAYEPTCTPLATPLCKNLNIASYSLCMGETSHLPLLACFYCNFAG